MLWHIVELDCDLTKAMPNPVNMYRIDSCLRKVMTVFLGRRRKIGLRVSGSGDRKKTFFLYVFLATGSDDHKKTFFLYVFLATEQDHLNWVNVSRCAS